ncbi:MAG: hypothetical protein V3V37_00210 [Candidatus Adiutricales bacterium]
MKITPNLTVIRGQGNFSPRRQAKAAPAPKYNRGVGAHEDIVEVVSLENRRALKGIPRSQEELDRLLLDVKTGIERMNPEEIKKLHRLEGLVHVFSER